VVYTYRIVRRQVFLTRDFGVVSGTENIARLLEGIFDFAGCEKCCGSGILRCGRHSQPFGFIKTRPNTPEGEKDPTYHEAVFSIGVLKAEFMEVNDCCVECLDWTRRIVSLTSSSGQFVFGLGSLSQS